MAYSNGAYKISSTEFVNRVKANLPRYAEFEYGSYTGTGKSGKSYPCQITFGISPKLVIISDKTGGIDQNKDGGWNSYNIWYINSWPSYYTKGYGFGYSDFENYATKRFLYGMRAGKTIYWYVESVIPTYADNPDMQLNENGERYYYVCFA